MGIGILPLTEEHLSALMVLDHSCQTNTAWKMDMSVGLENRTITFKKINLPRPMLVVYPRSFSVLQTNWEDRDLNLIAMVDEEIAGYLSIPRMVNPKIAWVSDLAVNHRFRRMGVGTALMNAVRIWASNNDCKKIMLEMLSKNFPAIEFAKHLGFDFCGYNDTYYSNFDIAVFFSKNI